MRPRSESIGTLGRAPARASKQPPVVPPPIRDDEPQRGAIRRWIHGALFENVGLKFLSMVLAITVFLLVNTDRDREITARVGVSYTLPDDKVLVSPRLDEVQVVIKGPWRRLSRFDERELDRIHLDLRRAASGETPIRVTPEMIHLPPGLTISDWTPHSTRVQFDDRVEKIVEVNPQVVGRPQHGYVMSDAKTAPATIKVRGAETTLAALAIVHTRPISVEGRAESFSAETEVDAPYGVEVMSPAPVVARVTIDEELVTRRMPGLVVQLRGEGGGDPAKWQVEPAQIDVTLTGALLAVEKAKARIVPIVKVGPDGKPHDVDVALEGVPPGIGVKVSPERVRATPVK
ncbi:MAG TPA: CdaR family protein [Kofleriaceae bacterium]|nr:CdaR family protein [Kofleriaceae bacterium]